MKTKHDGDCQIYRGRICTCGYLHDIKPYSEKWTEQDEEEMVWQEYLTELLYKMADTLELPKPPSSEEIEKRKEEFYKMWIEMGGRVAEK